jgi:SAM-dependent methyltransferase
MRPLVARRLLDLNRSFYGRFAAEFSRSRSVLQPGILRALDYVSPFALMLDLGCGDARVGDALLARRLPGALGRWTGSYVGVDQSTELLGQREVLLRELPSPTGEPHASLCAADITRPGWWKPLGLRREGFDAVVCFSVLHHVPTLEARKRLLEDIARFLAPGGACALSVWQVLHRDRFRRKIVPWSRIGLDASDVEDGDLLIDWQAGGEGLRYVHHFDLVELAGLCEGAGLAVTHHFRADGDSGDLGLYLIAR